MAAMVELSRVVRFCVSPGDRASLGEKGRNTFAAWPAMVGIGAFFELEVRCRGEVDPITGYLVNISEIDKAVRSRAVPIISEALRHRPDTPPWRLLPELLRATNCLGVAVSAISWRLSPYHAVSMSKSAPDQVVLSETFEFAAAHRLNCRGLSEEANRRLFGKCNNPSGHGHNYRVEVSIAVPLEAAELNPPFDHLALERIVDELVVRRFDHMNLDVDTEEFKGKNSSVENIARACYDLLREPLTQAGARLIRVRVWETEKTSCTYPAEA